MKTIKKVVNVKKVIRDLTPAETKKISGARSRSGASCETNGSSRC